MKPVRIKYCGLIPMTRRTYLILQGIGFVVLAILLVVAIAFPKPRFGLEERQLGPVAVWFLDHLPWLVLLITVLEVLDAAFTLRQFARQEALRRNVESGEVNSASTP